MKYLKHSLINNLVPLCKRNKVFNPAVAAAAVTGGLNFLGDLLGFGSQSQTNKTNLKIARMNNEYNRAMYEDQKQFTFDMWNAQNQYNTPTAQMQRYRDAGLNPYLMMSPGDAGQAQSVNTPTAQPAATPNIQPYDFHGVGEAGSAAVNTYFQAKALDADIGQKEAQNKVLNAQADSIVLDNDLKSLQLKYEDTWLNNRNLRSKLDYDFQMGLYSKQQSQMPYIYRQARNEMDLSDLGISYQMLVNDSMYLDYKIKDYRFQKLPQEFKLQFGLISAQIFKEYMQGHASSAQASLFNEQSDYTRALTKTENRTRFGSILDKFADAYSKLVNAYNLNLSSSVQRDIARENLKFLLDTHGSRVQQEYNKSHSLPFFNVFSGEVQGNFNNLNYNPKFK